MKRECNDRMRRNIGVNTMMRHRYPDGQKQSSLAHSYQSQWRKTPVTQKKSEKEKNVGISKPFIGHPCPIVLPVKINQKKVRRESNGEQRDAIVVMGSQNHPWATVLLVLLHTSTGFTEKGGMLMMLIMNWGITKPNNFHRMFHNITILNIKC